jgi:hypothetical protein
MFHYIEFKRQNVDLFMYFVLALIPFSAFMHNAHNDFVIRSIDRYDLQISVPFIAQGMYAQAF